LGRIVAAWSRKEFNTEDTERTENTENTEKNRDNFKKVNAETLRQAAEELG
jgi:hypothetical protein